MANHFIDMRRGLNGAVDSYNRAVGSFESRVLVSARKFQEIDTAVKQEIPVIESISTTTRELTGEEGSEG